MTMTGVGDLISMLRLGPVGECIATWGCLSEELALCNPRLCSVAGSGGGGIPDFSRYRLERLKEHLAECSDHRVAVLEQMVARAKAGVGVKQDILPPLFRQSSDECQTLAVLNGVAAWGGSAVVASYLSCIQAFRAQARQVFGSKADYRAGAVATIMAKTGLPVKLVSPESFNPIPLVEKLFQPGGFMVPGIAGHEYSVVPFAEASAEGCFVMKLDSLATRAEAWNARQLLDFLLGEFDINRDSIVMFQYTGALLAG